MASRISNPEPFLNLIEAKAELSGRFTQMKRLGPTGGGGQFSLLCEAHDNLRGEKVALKFFDPNVKDSYRVESFAREVEVLEKLRGQPDILQSYSGMQQVVESFTHPLGMTISVPLNFYALELAETDLGTILEEAAVEPADKLEWFRGLCRAIHRVHKQGIAHRDIKPSNCLIMRDGAIKLSDFGTARCLTDGGPSLKRYEAPPGDWVYASPEMIAGLHDASPEIAYRADMYALGALLFEMFTGAPLNLHVFGPSLLGDFHLLMRSVLPGDKVNEFHKAIKSICNRYPLPDVRDFGANAPRSIAPILNRMYRDLAALDYRNRAEDCSTTFLQISQCLLVLRNEAAYARWMQYKRARREAQERKQAKIRHHLASGAKS